MHAELAAENFDFLLADPATDWQRLVRRYAENARGENLPADHVRSAFLLADVDGDVVGRVSIRFELNEYLRQFGGHAGYAVAARYRRRGYAREILRQAVQILNDAGVTQVLVTCPDANEASARTIESCGGTLENTVIAPTVCPCGGTGSHRTDPTTTRRKRNVGHRLVPHICVR